MQKTETIPITVLFNTNCYEKNKAKCVVIGEIRRTA
jgi:hypothetical protein